MLKYDIIWNNPLSFPSPLSMQLHTNVSFTASSLLILVLHTRSSVLLYLCASWRRVVGLNCSSTRS